MSPAHVGSQGDDFSCVCGVAYLTDRWWYGYGWEGFQIGDGTVWLGRIPAGAGPGVDTSKTRHPTTRYVKSIKWRWAKDLEVDIGLKRAVWIHP